MSTYAGTVGASSICATAQSIGAAGLATSTYVTATAAAVPAAIDVTKRVYDKIRSKI